MVKTCGECGGSGKVQHPDWAAWWRDHVEVPPPDSPLYQSKEEVDCPECGGTGTVGQMTPDEHLARQSGAAVVRRALWAATEFPDCFYCIHAQVVYAEPSVGIRESYTERCALGHWDILPEDKDWSGVAVFCKDYRIDPDKLAIGL